MVERNAIMYKQKGPKPLDVRTDGRHPHVPRAFTLIELLVVIAVIALLMSILMPALTKAKQQAKAVICLHNCHEWGLVMKMFTDNNKGLFMGNLGHASYAALAKPELLEYFKNPGLLICPMATRTYNRGGKNPFAAWRSPSPTDPLGSLPSSYGINTWILSKATAQFQTDDRMWKTPNIRLAAYVPMITDVAGYQNASPWDYDMPPRFDGEFITSSSLDEMKYVCLNRHNEHVIMVFCDYSSRKVGLKELWTLKWNRKFDTKGPWTIAGGVQRQDWERDAPWMAHMKDY